MRYCYEKERKNVLVSDDIEENIKKKFCVGGKRRKKERKKALKSIKFRG
jgi:hypothetical protein